MKIKEEASSKVDFVLKNNHKYNYLLNKADIINNYINYLVNLNLNENSENELLAFTYYELYKLIKDFNYLLKEKTQEYESWLIKIDNFVKLIKKRQADFLNFKNKNKIIHDIDHIKNNIEEILTNYNQIPDNENIDDIKLRYKKMIESYDGLYKKTINDEANKIKNIKSDVKNLKHNYFEKIDNGEEYYKLYNREIMELFHEANQLHENISSVLQSILNRKLIENKIDNIKREIQEHKKVSQYIKQNGYKNNQDFWDTWKEDILGKKFIYQTLMDNTNVAIWYGLALKIEDLAKQKFINTKSLELKQLIEKWKLYGQALIRDSLDAANFSGLFFTIKSKTSMLDNWQPSIDPNSLSKKGKYYLLIKKLKDLTNEIEKKARNANQKLSRFYDSVVKDDVEQIVPYIKAVGYGFYPQEEFGELMYWSNYYLNQLPDVFQYYKEKIIKPIIDQIKSKSDSANDVSKLEELYNFKYHYTNIYEPFNQKRDNFYYYSDYKTDDKGEKIKNSDEMFILTKQVPNHLKNEYDTARLFFRIERTIGEICKKYALTNPLE